MPIKANIYNQTGDKVGEKELTGKIFGLRVNPALVHQAMVAQEGNIRQVLAHTKTRSEVRGGGRKPWRQKGTGRARHGSIRSPLWIGGGITFGPRRDRNFKKKINLKMKRQALFMALADRVKSERFYILEGLKIDEYKTKIFNSMLKALEAKAFAKTEDGTKKKAKRSILVIADKSDDKIKYSGRNLAGVSVISIDNINLLDLLKHRDLVIFSQAVDKLEERYKK